MTGTPRLDFRPDIQGLRALAVLLVLAFHLGWEDVSGGYVGVDVFFVVSGYLITALIVRERLVTGRFDFARFTSRRLRRLFPALAVTVLATLALAATVLPPEHAGDTVRSALAAITYTENVLAWRQAGYFDAGAAAKPLLHAWSLGVEEQFYLAWPLLIALGCKLAGLRGAMLAALAAGAASFAGNLAAADPVAVFFLSPFRVFEFAIGALAWGMRDQAPVRGKLAGVVVALGLAAVLYAALEYDEAMTFPGTNALLPCLGTAAVLVAGDRTRAFAWLLENRGALLLGRISYALYLVHWPVFLAYVALRFPGAGYISLRGADAAYALLASFVVGTALHYGVEAPLRRAKVRWQGALLVGAPSLALVAGTAALVGTRTPSPDDAVIAATGDRAEGLRGVLRYYDDEQEQRHTWQAIRAADTPFGGGVPKILIVGDSQAADLMNVLPQVPALADASIRALPSSKPCQIAFAEGFYASGAYLAEGGGRGIREHCDERRAAITDDPRVAEADLVVLAFAWYADAPRYLPGELDAYRALGAKRLAVVAKKDLAGGSLDLLAASGGEIAAAEAGAALTGGAAATNAALAASGVPVLGLAAALSGPALPSPGGRTLFTPSGYPVYYDARHLTERGAAWAARTDGMGAFAEDLSSLATG